MIDLNLIQFDPEQHRYWLAGTESPSVTTVLEAEGLSGCAFWQESDRRRGSAVHHIALLLAKRPWRGSTVEEIVANSPWDPEHTATVLVGYGMAVAKFYLESGLRPQLVEQVVASQRLGICGTLDVWGACEYAGSMCNLLVDFKSGQPQAAANIQTALYAYCLEESMGLKTDQRAVVWIKSDGTYKMFVPRPAGGVDLAIGQAAVSLYKWRQANNKLG